MAAVPTQIGLATHSADLSLRAYLARQIEDRGARIGFGSAAAAVLIGWLIRGHELFDAESDLGYFLGVVAVACMTGLLVFPLRKRFAALALLGSTKNWFRVHMFLGTLGPVLALYHCNFSTGAMNSRVALYAALLVAGSGLVGRYIYSKVHIGLTGRRKTLQELLSRIEIAAPAAAQTARFVPELTKRLVDFDRTVLVPPESLWACFVLPVKLAIVTRIEYWRMVRFARREIRLEGLRSARLRRFGASLERITREYIARHLRQVRSVAEFVAYQRLFALWHTVHRPFFAILVVSVVIHVIAVHVY